MKKLMIALTGIVAALGIIFSANNAVVSEAKSAPQFAVGVEGTDNDLNEIAMAMYVDDSNNTYAYVTDYKDTTYGVCSDTIVNHNGYQAELIRVNGFTFYFYEAKGMKLIELEDGHIYACDYTTQSRINDIRSMMG